MNRKVRGEWGTVQVLRVILCAGYCSDWSHQMVSSIKYARILMCFFFFFCFCFVVGFFAKGGRRLKIRSDP